MMHDATQDIRRMIDVTRATIVETQETLKQADALLARLRQDQMPGVTVTTPVDCRVASKVTASL